MFKKIFDTLFLYIGKPAVKAMEWLKQTFQIDTYLVENIFVFSVLAITVIATRNYANLWKWVELLAVFFTF